MDPPKVEIITTSKKKPCLIVDGFQHRLFRRSQSNNTTWLCLKERAVFCKGKVKTNDKNEIISQTKHTCGQSSAEIEIKKKMEICRKRAREDLSVPVCDIFKEEMANILNKGVEFRADIPSYSNVKTVLCRERRLVVSALKDNRHRDEVEFSEESLLLSNEESFLRFDFYTDDGGRILVFAGEETEQLLNNGKKWMEFLFDGTYKSCPPQFAQLYTIHVDFGNSDSVVNIYPIIYAFLPDKKEQTYRALFQILKDWCPEFDPRSVRMDFDNASISACKSAFPKSEIRGFTFHYKECLWRKIKEIGFHVEFNMKAEIRRACEMCAALTYIPESNVMDGYLATIREAPGDERLFQFFGYFKKQWLDNPDIPISMWNVYGQRRNDFVIGEWRKKFNCKMRKFQSGIQGFVAGLKKESEEVSSALKSGESGIKMDQMHVDLDESIFNILKDYEKSKDLKTCLSRLGDTIKLN